MEPTHIAISTLAVAFVIQTLEVARLARKVRRIERERTEDLHQISRMLQRHFLNLTNPTIYVDENGDIRG